MYFICIILAVLAWRDGIKGIAVRLFSAQGSGTVRYITNQPELGVHSTFGEIGGNWIQGGNGGAVAKLGANVPLGDWTAGRIAVYHNQIAGYMDAVQPDLSVRGASCEFKSGCMAFASESSLPCAAASSSSAGYLVLP